MSELVFTKMPVPGNLAAGVGGVDEGTPVFIYKWNGGALSQEDIANIKFIKKAIGIDKTEKMNQDILDQLTAMGKRNGFAERKFNEVKTINNKICDFVLDTLHMMSWKIDAIPGAFQNGVFVPNVQANAINGGRNFTQQANVQNAISTTLDINECLKIIRPAFQSLAQIYDTLIEEKYPSKLIGKIFEHMKEQNKLEIEQKTGKFLGKY